MKAQFITWLLFFFIGFAGGVIVGVWLDKDTYFKGNVKIKQRGKGNVQKPEITAEMGPLKQWKVKRQKKRFDKLMEKM